MTNEWQCGDIEKLPRRAGVLYLCWMFCCLGKLGMLAQLDRYYFAGDACD